jgi:hypothetical protein
MLDLAVWVLINGASSPAEPMTEAPDREPEFQAPSQGPAGAASAMGRGLHGAKTPFLFRFAAAPKRGNQRHRAAPALAADKPGNIQQAALEHALYHAQHYAQHRRDQPRNGLNPSLMNCGSREPMAASVCAMNSATCRYTRR